MELHIGKKYSTKVLKEFSSNLGDLGHYYSWLTDSSFDLLQHNAYTLWKIRIPNLDL